jgi:hypothetical protein
MQPAENLRTEIIAIWFVIENRGNNQTVQSPDSFLVIQNL